MFAFKSGMVQYEGTGLRLMQAMKFAVIAGYFTTNIVALLLELDLQVTLTKTLITLLI